MRCIYFLISGLVDGNMSEGGIFPLLLDLFNFFELFLELFLGINLFLLDAWACPVSPSLHLLIFFIFVLLVQLVLIFHNFFHLKFLHIFKSCLIVHLLVDVSVFGDQSTQIDWNSVWLIFLLKFLQIYSLNQFLFPIVCFPFLFFAAR